MSGHNKWSKIKNKKGVTDAQKSKIFTKLVRAIAVEAKKSAGDVNSPGLRTAIEKAKAENMPSQNIEKAIKKATEGGDTPMEAVTYEAYGPEGVAIIIESLTDNRNKAAAEIKHILSKNNLELAPMGAASWAFTKINGAWEATSNIEITEQAGLKLQKLIEDLEDNDDVQEIYTNAN